VVEIVTKQDECRIVDAFPPWHQRGGGAVHGAILAGYHHFDACLIPGFEYVVDYLVPTGRYGDVAPARAVDGGKEHGTLRKTQSSYTNQQFFATVFTCKTRASTSGQNKEVAVVGQAHEKLGVASLTW
jgi:hypothetical protein